MIKKVIFLVLVLLIAGLYFFTDATKEFMDDTFDFIKEKVSGDDEPQQKEEKKIAVVVEEKKNTTEDNKTKEENKSN